QMCRICRLSHLYPEQAEFSLTSRRDPPAAESVQRRGAHGRCRPWAAGSSGVVAPEAALSLAPAGPLIGPGGRAPPALLEPVDGLPGPLVALGPGGDAVVGEERVD